MTQYTFTELEIHEIAEAIKKREKDLKRERSRADGMGLAGAVQACDDALRVIKGDGPLRPGLKAKLGIDSEEKDPDQIEHGNGDEADYRSWDLTVSGVEELVATISSSDKAPFAKIRELRSLEAGEKERGPKPRDGALKAIRTAIEPLKSQVRPITEEPDIGAQEEAEV